MAKATTTKSLDSNYFDDDYYNRKNMFEVLKKGGYVKGSHKKLNLWKWDFIKDFYKKNKGSVIDLGCGAGFFLECVPDEFSTYGLDISSSSIKIVTKKGFNAVEADLSKGVPAKLKGKKFDVVRAFDTLEHVPDLDLFLENTTKIMNKNSLFFVEVPIKTMFHNFISKFGLGLLNIDPTHINKENFIWWKQKFSKNFKIVSSSQVTYKKHYVKGFGLLGLFVLKLK
jgi:2-polyprenyl-3-methyl-5-hydroxy-6-metoxy-1,4-benzoquinol methylase